MQHVKYKKYTYYLFLGTVVQQMIQRFLESLACILKSPINECQWSGFYSSLHWIPGQFVSWWSPPIFQQPSSFLTENILVSIAISVVPPVIVFFFVPFCSFLYLNSLSLSQSRLNWIEMWAQSSEPWALFGSLSFQFWQKISSGEDGQRILNMFFSYFHHLKSASKFLAWCCPPDVWQHNIEYQRNVAITHFPGTLPTSTRPPHQCQLPQSKTHTQRCSTFFIQFCVGKIIC